jgi:hypothetical protein
VFGASLASTQGLELARRSQRPVHGGNCVRSGAFRPRGDVVAPAGEFARPGWAPHWLTAFWRAGRPRHANVSAVSRSKNSRLSTGAA